MSSLEAAADVELDVLDAYIKDGDLDAISPCLFWRGPPRLGVGCA